MKNYVKPVVLENEEIFEGVYAASGAGDGTDCYTVTYNIHQTPETGREDYRVQLDATHAAQDAHHSGVQTLVISFTHAVNFSFCNGANGTCVGGDGTNTLRIEYQYHNNGNDYIGLGDLVVTCEGNPADLGVTGAYLICNHDCFQH